jgi:hypothetical protein
MLLRSKTGRLAILVCAAAFVPVVSASREAPPRPASILITGPAALDVSLAVYDAVLCIAALYPRSRLDGLSAAHAAS